MKTTNLIPNTLTQEQINLLIQEAEDVKACNEALKGNSPQQIIEFYLDYQQSRMPELNAAYPNNKLGKTVKDCYGYIMDKARKQATGSQYMAHHKIVFGWAVEYFVNDDIKKFEQTKPAPAGTSTTTKADYKRLHDEWEIAHKSRVEEWEKSHQEAINKWSKEHQFELFFDPALCPELQKENPFLKEKNPYPDKKEKKDTDIKIVNGEPVNTTTGEILNDPDGDDSDDE